MSIYNVQMCTQIFAEYTRIESLNLDDYVTRSSLRGIIETRNEYRRWPSVEEYAKHIVHAKIRMNNAIKSYRSVDNLSNDGCLR